MGLRGRPAGSRDDVNFEQAYLLLDYLYTHKRFAGNRTEAIPASLDDVTIEEPERQPGLALQDRISLVSAIHEERPSKSYSESQSVSSADHISPIGEALEEDLASVTSPPEAYGAFNYGLFNPNSGSKSPDSSQDGANSEPDDVGVEPRNPEHWHRIRTPYFWFPLHAAAKAGSHKIVKLLISYGALLDPPSHRFCVCQSWDEELTYKTTQRWTPLHTALCSGNEHIALFLMAKGSSQYLDANHTTTIVHTVATFGSVTALKQCLVCYALIGFDDQDYQGKTPLQLAHYGKRNTAVMQ
ncbi:hypothetical protein TruAng_009422 [Truncatella angustata]|nr:hypothetical protein TruAng_009422 [Truncatella angustata]